MVTESFATCVVCGIVAIKSKFNPHLIRKYKPIKHVTNNNNLK